MRAVRLLKQGRLDEYAAAFHPGALAGACEMLTLQIKQAERSGDAEKALPLFRGCRSIAEVRQLSRAAMFAAYLRSALAQAPDLKESLAANLQSVVGHYRQAPDLAHVVYRDTGLDRRGKRKIGVYTLRKTAGRWGLLLPGDLQLRVTVTRIRLSGGDPSRKLPEPQVFPWEVVGHVRESPSTAYILTQLVTRVVDTRHVEWNAVRIDDRQPGWDLMLRKEYAALTKLAQERGGRLR